MTNYRELLENEIFVIDGKLLTSRNGLTLLSGANKNSVLHCMSKYSVGHIDVVKTSEALLVQGKSVGYKTRAWGIEPDGVTTVLCHFATSRRVTKEIQHKSAQVLKAFATRGYEAWVSDMLGVKLDHTKSNAAINQLLATYPSLNSFVNAKPMDKVPCRVWLAEMMERLEGELLELNYEQAVITELHEYLRNRLPQMAAATHKVILGYAPVATLVKVNGKEVSQYLYETDAPLKSAYIHLMAEFMYNKHQEFLQNRL